MKPNDKFARKDLNIENVQAIDNSPDDSPDESAMERAMSKEREVNRIIKRLGRPYIIAKDLPELRGFGMSNAQKFDL